MSGNQASAVPQGDDQRRARPESEDVTDQPAATRRRVEEARQPQWTMSSSVKDILLEGSTLRTDMKLNDFLRSNLGGRGVVDTNENVAMEMFVLRPTMFINDSEILGLITASPSYQELEREMKRELEKRKILLEAINKLQHEGVHFLEQWRYYQGKATLTPLVCEKLNGVFAQVQREKREANERAMLEAAKVLEAEMLEGCYESVYNARWHHVVEVPDDTGMGMEVKEGEPPQSWTYKKVGETFEKNDAVQQFSPPRPRLMVLTSEKAWPYSWVGNRRIRDCYVNCEVDRVWQIVKGELTKWFSFRGWIDFEPNRHLLIGTPGIGKSMGAGSYLLYQLLHCDVEKLQVVVYVIADEAFLFDKTAHTVTQYHTDEMSRSVIPSLRKRGMKGYVIYDVAKDGRKPSVFLVPSEWGMIVLTSPNENNFKQWKKDKRVVPIVIDCPHRIDLKAMCFWMKHIQPTEEQTREQLEEQTEEQAMNPAQYWEKVEKRVDEVGPIPRCIFNVLEYNTHVPAIDKAIENINASNATDYMGVGSDKIWIAEDVSHKIVKVLRMRAVSEIEVGYNAPVSRSAMIKITHHLTNMTPPVDILNLLLRSFGYLVWAKLEQSGTATFMNPHAVDIIQRNLTELHPGGRSRSRFSVLSDNPRGHPTRSEILQELRGNPARMDLKYGVLYEPIVRNFPLVDALFFTESPRRTLVGLQTTTANAHHTQTSTVRLFKERMAEYFNGWEEFARDLSWEIIYAQHADSTPIRGWQRCDDSANLTEAENREIAAFWEEKVHQYQVTVAAEMLLQNRPPEVSDN
ncbi:putative retrotransposon hot spot (RHS) protein [Trypanosoma cruzi]|uniref:Retrotransposon hot spot (RHS) protein, putative n=2 Tax=Trypanosoma cruzi TaxID=5693 RepID=Q4DME9_TRYCC|nr:retrotransposon hot spot (RHS) protein, putative [Trypanosoma cruzi]EAN93710.1 retrotransposon hot spot (RHS) protein, putative [Trypanosoma cruzi]PWU89035.1 putative retrotransposon hot spot (RHS) protein [Trypanosoma cruzi]RNC46439.1 putative retrotransposon hot spot (RHS) protein [Trypanosoma cruzi]|eukprot:XP_815561.1 retrotransposon hot spot (RHS) protein [Trypanosoma cruzi strain CL Brener]